MQTGLPFNIDLDRANSALRLLFGFIRDDRCQDPELQSFETAVADVFQGLVLAPQVIEKVRSVYERTMEEGEEITTSATQVANEFSSSREVLIAIVKILLRLSMDEGLVCTRDKERMTSVLNVFNLSSDELEWFTEEELSALVFFMELPYAGQVTTELLRHYKTLGCNPDVSDRELRTRYRDLVMRFHPDRHTSRDDVTPEQTSSRQRFEAVHLAYSVIKRARKSSS